MAFNPKAWLNIVRTVDRLLTLEKSHRALIDKQGHDIQELKDRLTRLEESVAAREQIMVAEAKGAAAVVGSAVAAQHVADISRRLGALEERTRPQRLLTGVTQQDQMVSDGEGRPADTGSRDDDQSD